VICENCGRIGTTLATDYDGKTVAYECKVDYVEWARAVVTRAASRHSKGTRSFFGTSNGARSGTTSASRTKRAEKISSPPEVHAIARTRFYREVFKKEPPLGLAHEFFNARRKKMSTSKGVGATAVELVSIYPPDLTRFLMLRTPPRRHVEFDPSWFDPAAALRRVRPLR